MKITVLPTFLINWLEDNGFEFENTSPGDLSFKKPGNLTYINLAKTILIYLIASEYGTAFTPVKLFPKTEADLKPPIPACLITPEMTEVEFLQGIVDLGK